MGIKSFWHRIVEFVSGDGDDSDLGVDLPKAKANGAKDVEARFNLSSVAKATMVVILLIGVAYLATIVIQPLIMLFVAFLLASALLPTVDWLAKRRISPGLSVIVLYIISITVVVAFLSSFLPILGQELVNLARTVQGWVVQLGEAPVNADAWYSFIVDPIREFIATQDFNAVFEQLKTGLVDIGTRLTAFTGSAFQVVMSFFNGLLNFIVVLFLAFFLVVDREAVNKFIVSLFPKRYENYLSQKNLAIQRKIGYWLQGQIALMVSIAIITYIGLLILGVDYALTLAVFAGLAELLPAIGPLVAMLVAIPIVANQALWLVIAVPILFIIIQQLENNILVPMIMKKAVGLSPIAVIFSALIGYELLGILGLILSVPVASTINLFLDDYRRS